MTGNETSFVDSFFRKAGLVKQLQPDKFWQELERRYGALALRLGECINQRESGVAIDPYPIKNDSIDFANAVASQFDLEKLKTVAVWFLREGILTPGGKALELGCDNGLLLCLLAKAHPDTAFFGIDPCAKAIDIARTRAQQLGLSNIEFNVADIAGAVDVLPSTHFDAIFSVAVFHEVLAGGLIGKTGGGLFNELSGHFSLNDLDNSIQASPNHELDVVRRLLSDQGYFVSVDRWPAPQQTLAWVRTAEASGLSLNIPMSYMLSYPDRAVGQQRLPLTCFTKGHHVASAPQVLSFQSYLDFEKSLAPLGNITNPMLAELVHSSLDKKPLVGLKADYLDGGGVESMTLGIAGGLGYLYRETNLGFRFLSLFPSALLKEKMSSIAKLRPEYERSADLSMQVFNGHSLGALGISEDFIGGLSWGIVEELNG